MDITQLDQPDQAKLNAQRLEVEIAALQTISLSASHNGFRGFWAHSKQIIELFKTLRPLKPEDRQRLWESYRAICDGIQKQQSQQRESFKTESGARRHEIESAVCKARELLADNSLAGLATARELLRTALQKMKGEPLPGSSPTGAAAEINSEAAEVVPEVGPMNAVESVDSTTEPVNRESAVNETASVEAHSTEQAEPPVHLTRPRLLKEDREECWRQWQEVRNLVQVRLDTSQAAITAAASELAAKAHSENPPVILKAVRDLQQQVVQLGLPKVPREQIRATLNDAWTVAISRLQTLREERKTKHQEWRNRMEENLQRWHGQVERREQSIAHLQTQVEKLQDMLQNARSDEHRERVQGWLDETSEKLRKNELAAVDIREKIAAVESKLRR